MPKRITGRWSSRGTRRPCIQELLETCPLDATPSSLTCARSHPERGCVTVFEALELDSFIEDSNAYFEPSTIFFSRWHPRNERRGIAEVRFLAQHLAASSEACGSGRRFFLTILRFVRAVHLGALMDGIQYRSDYAAVTSIHCGAARRMRALLGPSTDRTRRNRPVLWRNTGPRKRVCLMVCSISSLANGAFPIPL
ncbi:hypothetical protein BC826DRAFT_591919 [Russula brevipes]|nr:hypothetical protein BC826DRAFT_591919 [Russula brevipes]